jgi:4'-phosphopantetheinyl transferase EntD
VSEQGTLISDLFPSFVETAELFTFPGIDHLFEAERIHVQAATEVRRAEFAAGRSCAREAMSQLGIARVPILAGPNRVPLWPEGVCGSITHTREYAAAALCRRRDAESIGLDVEPALPLDEDLIDIVCSPDELGQAFGLFEPGLLAKLLFSAKECAFKCQFPLTGRYLEFVDVNVTLDAGTGQFEAGVKGFQQVRGRFLLAQGLIATGIVLA